MRRRGPVSERSRLDWRSPAAPAPLIREFETQVESGEGIWAMTVRVLDSTLPGFRDRTVGTRHAAASEPKPGGDQRRRRPAHRPGGRDRDSLQDRAELILEPLAEGIQVTLEVEVEEAGCDSISPDDIWPGLVFTTS